MAAEIDFLLNKISNSNKNRQNIKICQVLIVYNMFKDYDSEMLGVSIILSNPYSCTLLGPLHKSYFFNINNLQGDWKVTPIFNHL